MQWRSQIFFKTFLKNSFSWDKTNDFFQAKRKVFLKTLIYKLLDHEVAKNGKYIFAVVHMRILNMMRIFYVEHWAYYSVDIIKIGHILMELCSVAIPPNAPFYEAKWVVILLVTVEVSHRYPIDIRKMFQRMVEIRRSLYKLWYNISPARHGPK